MPHHTHDGQRSGLVYDVRRMQPNRNINDEGTVFTGDRRGMKGKKRYKQNKIRESYSWEYGTIAEREESEQ